MGDKFETSIFMSMEVNEREWRNTRIFHISIYAVSLASAFQKLIMWACIYFYSRRNMRAERL